MLFPYDLIRFYVQLRNHHRVVLATRRYALFKSGRATARKRLNETRANCCKSVARVPRATGHCRAETFAETGLTESQL